MAEELSLIINSPSNGEFLKNIGWNKQEFMNLVASITERYKGLTYTEEQMKEAKADRARLNSMKKIISDRRIEIKNSVMAPYIQFEKEVNEVVNLIDEPILMIDSQIKEYEERLKDEKKQNLIEFFNKEAADYSFLTFEKVFDKKYLNSSVSLNKAKDDIKQKIERIVNDFISIDTLTSEKYRGAAKDVYIKTLSLSAAIGEDRRLTEIDRRQEEERLRLEKEKNIEIEAQKISKPQYEIPVKEEVSAISQSDFNEKVPPKNTDDSLHNNSIKQEPKIYKSSFTVYGTKAQIMALKQYMIDNNIKFGKE